MKQLERIFLIAYLKNCSKNKKILLYICILTITTFFSFISLFAAPPTTKYFRGETLNPSCAPGDLNCDVEDFIDTDNQSLSISGSVLSIIRGNSVSIPSSSDNLGDHTATQNIKTNGYWISGGGINEGIFANTGGNIGINISSPSNNLSVHNPTSGTSGSIGMFTYGASSQINGYRASGTISTPSGISGLNIVSQFIGLGYDGSAYRSIGSMQVISESTPNGTSAPGQLRFNTTTTGSIIPSEKMRITSDGFIGIGTSTPANKLSVADGFISIEGTTAYGIRMYRSGTLIGSLTTASNMTTLSTLNGGGFQFLDNLANPIVTLLNSGNFGIGTNAPIARLHVAGGTITVPDSGTNSERFGYNTTATGTLALAVGYTASAGGFEATALGSNSNASNQYTVAIGRGTVASGNMSTSIGRAANTGGAYSIALGYSANTLAAHAGSIAIGNSTATNASNQFVVGSATPGYDIRNVIFGISSSSAYANTYGGVTIQGTDGNGANIAGANVSIGSGRGTGTGAGGVITFKTSSASVSSGVTLNSWTERMRIDTLGNVGIGTSSPQATLDIDGFVRLKSNSAAPAICSATNAGSIALTSAYTLCICNGTSWIDSTSNSSCSW